MWEKQANFIELWDTLFSNSGTAHLRTDTLLILTFLSARIKTIPQRDSEKFSLTCPDKCAAYFYGCLCTMSSKLSQNQSEPKTHSFHFNNSSWWSMSPQFLINESSISHISIWWLVILSTEIRAVDCSCGYIFFQNRCIALTHVNISNVDIQFGTIGTQQETKHGAQESNGLEASCKAQNSCTKFVQVCYPLICRDPNRVV